MKIYRLVRIDIETGEILEEISYEYAGPVALCEGDSEGEGEGEDEGDFGEGPGEGPGFGTGPGDIGGGDVDVSEGGSEEPGSGDRGQGGEAAGESPGLGGEGEIGDFDTQTGNWGDPGIDVAETEFGGPVGPSADVTGRGLAGYGYDYGIDPLGGFAGWDESKELGLGYAPQPAKRPSGVPAREVTRTFAGFKRGTGKAMATAAAKGLKAAPQTALAGGMISGPGGFAPGGLLGLVGGFAEGLYEESQFDYSLDVGEAQGAGARAAGEEPGGGGEGYTKPAAEPATPAEGQAVPPEVEPTIPQEVITGRLPGRGAFWLAPVFRPSLVELGEQPGREDWWFEYGPSPTLAQQRSMRRAA